MHINIRTCCVCNAEEVYWEKWRSRSYMTLYIYVSDKYSLVLHWLVYGCGYRSHPREELVSGHLLVSILVEQAKLRLAEHIKRIHTTYVLHTSIIPPGVTSEIKSPLISLVILPLHDLLIVISGLGFEFEQIANRWCLCITYYIHMLCQRNTWLRFYQFISMVEYIL